MIASGDKGAGGSPAFSHARDIVELVVLTTDDLFLQTLREAVGGARRLWHVAAEDKVSHLLLAGEVGILVLDTQCLQSAAGTVLTQIKRQFPDLVLVVAGSRDDEASLAGLISSGVIYRFIHKPMSPGRARLFAEAAVRKYVEGRSRVAPAFIPRRRLDFNEPWVKGAAIAAVTLTVAAVATWALVRRGRSSEPAVAAAPAVAPGGTAAGGAAAAAVAAEQDRLLSVAENALLEERLDAAAAAIDAARKAGVDNGHLAFLSAQLAKSLERSKAAGAQNRARSDSRASGTSASGQPTATGEERLTQLLRLAAERIQRGQLIDPPHDNARLYIEEALRIDPHTNAAQAAKQSLALALLTEAHTALDRRDFTHAAAVLDAADGIAAPSNLESLRQQLTGARAQAAAEASEQLLKSGLERLQQDRLLEPPNDNAKYYLASLQATNPSYPGLAAARQDLGARLVAKARRAQTLQQPDAARAWLDEAAALGFSSPDATAVLHDLETARTATGAPGPSREVVPAGQLTLIKRVAPIYPRRAELDRIEGWVELDFTVTTDGAVKDVTIHGAEPAGVFNAAAIKALTQWRYQPVLRDATPISQRARIRIRFTLA